MADPVTYQMIHNGPLNADIVTYLKGVLAERRWTYKRLGDSLGISGAFAHNLLNKGGNISTNTYMARVAQGIERMKSGDYAAPDAPDSVPETNATFREHSFHLRDNLQVALKLPADLTEREAERLALFIRSLAQ
jgi:hypothetical protein